MTTAFDPDFECIVPVRVRGRVYRAVLPEGVASEPRGDSGWTATGSSRVEEEEEEVEEEEVVEIDGLAVTRDDRGFYRAEERIAAVFYPFLIGRGGAVLKRLCAETGCKITIPRRGDKKRSSVTYRADSREKLVSAHTRVHLIVESSVGKLAYTHFVSVPLAVDGEAREQVARSMADMRESVAAMGVDTSMFVRPERLHLTCFMLTLYTPEMVARARRVFEEQAAACYDLVGTTTVLLSLHGLEIMNDDVSEVDVLYARVEEDDGLAKLRCVCRRLIDAFREADLLSEEEVEKQGLLRTSVDDGKTQEVGIKFHATVMNSKYRKQDSSSKKKAKRIPFDASQIMEVWGKNRFGTTRVGSLELSSLSRFDNKTRYYHSEASIHMP